MSGERTLMIRVLGDASSGEKALGNLSAASDKATSSSAATSGALANVKNELLGMVPGGQQAASALEKMGGAGTEAGGALSGALAGGAAAAGVAVAGMAVEGVKHWSALTEEISKFKGVTGASAEESSKMVAVAHATGVETDALSGAMFKMGNVVASTPAKLTDLGIAIAHNKDGTVDMTGTLANAAEAWRNSADATKQDAIAKAIGGKAGAALIPILREGRDAVNEFAAAAKNRGEIASEKDLTQMIQFRQSMNELHQSFDAAEMSLGKGLIPSIERSTKELTGLVDAANKVGSALGGTTRVISVAQDVINPFGAMVHGISDQIGILTGRSKDHKKATDDATHSLQAQQTADKAVQDANTYLAESDKEAADAVKATSKAIDDEVKTLDSAAKATDSLAQADIAYKEKMIDAQVASGQLTQAQGDQQKAMFDGQKTILDAAQAAADLAQKQAEAAGQTFSARDAHDAYKQKLGEMVVALEPGSPLRAALQGYYDQLNSIPSQITTQLIIHGEDYTSVGPGGAVTYRASGGPVSPGTYVVGEQGPELLELGAGTSGRVLSNRASRAALGGVGDVNVTMNLTVHGVGDQSAFAQEIDRRVNRWGNDLLQTLRAS